MRVLPGQTLRRRRSRQSGILAVEFMVSSALFFIALVVFLGMIDTAVSASAHTNHVRLAIRAAEDGLEVARARKFADLKEGVNELGPFLSKGVAVGRQDIMQFNRELEVEVLSKGLKKCQVKVFYKVAGQAQQFSLTSYVVKR